MLYFLSLLVYFSCYIPLKLLKSKWPSLYILDTATHDVTYQSLIRLLVNHGESGSLQELPPIPERYIFGRSAEELKKETKQIQFKQLCEPQNRYDKTALHASNYI